ncbi:MAG TPA: DNA repair protein RecO [Clostridia bacterium]|jgi:DNA repair protein RecO|nr:DNA repair protein RecO [Clostridia bacterium]
MNDSVKALCVRTVDYGENDKILTLIALNKGLITVRAKGVREMKSKLKLAATPLSYGEYAYVERKQRKTLIGFSLIDNFMNCWRDLDKYASSQIVLEALDKTSKEEMEVDKELYIALITLSYINNEDIVPYVYSLWFLSKLLVILGVDLTDYYDITTDTKDLLFAISKAEPDDLGSLEIALPTIANLLSCISLVLKSEVSVHINSIDEAIKTIAKIK